MMYCTWISYNYRVVGDINIYEGVWCDQHIITYSYITHNAGIGPYPDPVPDYRNSCSFTRRIPAYGYSMCQVYLLSEFCSTVDYYSSIMANNKTFSNIRITF